MPPGLEAGRGCAIFQVYNRVSWLNALSKLMKVDLEHDDAPVLLKFSIERFRRLLSGLFADVRSCPSGFRLNRACTAGGRGASTTGRYSDVQSAAACDRRPRSGGICWRSAANDHVSRRLTPTGTTSFMCQSGDCGAGSPDASPPRTLLTGHALASARTV